MRSRQETTISSSNKTKGFKTNPSSWSSAVQKGDLLNFPSLLNLAGDKDLDKLKDRICDNLSRLLDVFSIYFHYETRLVHANEDEFIDLCADSTLNGKFTKSEASVAAFWLRLREKYPDLMKKTINALFPFSTSYLCEQDFSAMATKCEARNRLNNLEDDLRISLSSVRPSITYLFYKHQSQISH
ncbi:hypothetical protein ANN_17597 [Periplaneta americana]|uniref:HAT C-terminal dimerisation domain-containing protein n=1 Tax=Periplaneta americana TaxID=6978 RepID=A0ABQ8STY2_PERAM|nr:hypothetical protein ANN_17597 [Periplaneta americana]